MPPVARAVLLSLLVLSLPLPAAASSTKDTRIEADAVHFDLDLQQTRAVGKASLSYGDFHLRADQLSADRATGDVQANGHLTLMQRGRRLSGDTLEYNYHAEEGVLTNARVHEQGVIIGGERVELSPGRVVATQAYFTTCDRAEPHYSLGADRISLTAEESAADGRPTSGRLTFERLRVNYGRRRLFTLPRYSLSVGELSDPDALPLPVTGINRDDGPYASISYHLGGSEEAAAADIGYRYTTLRGIRGHLRARTRLGPLELGARYVRREDPADRELRPNDMEAVLADVLVNRTPEYGVFLPELRLTRQLVLSAEWLRGNYSERVPDEEEPRARGDRAATGVMISSVPYTVSPAVTLSHAVGWRRSIYSPGDRYTVRYYRHTVDLTPAGNMRLGLSYIVRRGSGETPFLFDRIEVGRELLRDLRWRFGPQWRCRVVDAIDLEARRTHDMMVSVTRTIHCLDYTLGWRQARRSVFFGVGIAPTSHEESR